MSRLQAKYVTGVAVIPEEGAGLVHAIGLTEHGAPVDILSLEEAIVLHTSITRAISELVASVPAESAEKLRDIINENCKCLKCEFALGILATIAHNTKLDTKNLH